MRKNGGGLTQVTFDGLSSNADWSPTGDFLVFTSGRSGGVFEIYRMRPDGSDQVAVTALGLTSFAPTWGKP